MNLIKGKVIYE